MEIQESILKEAARNLDISPSDFRRAQERFNRCKILAREWETTFQVKNQKYISKESFRLGTVVRPYRGDKDGDFDIGPGL